MSAREHRVLARGELDIASAPRLQAQLQSALCGRAQTVVLDLGDVTFIDSCGVRWLLGAIGACRESGREIRVVRPRCEAPNRTLRTMGLLARIPWLQDRAERAS